MELLEHEVSPPVAAYGAAPLSVAEMDAHPDSARLWATVLAMRAYYETVVSEHEDRLERAGDA